TMTAVVRRQGDGAAGPVFAGRRPAGSYSGEPGPGGSGPGAGCPDGWCAAAFCSGGVRPGQGSFGTPHGAGAGAEGSAARGPVLDRLDPWRPGRFEAGANEVRSDGLTAGARQRGGRRLPVVGSRGRGGIGLSGSRVASIDGQRARGWLAAALFVALLALPGPARAQIGFGPFLGPSFPVADLADAVSTGYHGGLALDVGIPFAPIGARADLTFQYMPGKDGADDFFQLFATASARLRFVPAAVFSLHLLGGAGLYGSSFDRALADGG